MRSNCVEEAAVAAPMAETHTPNPGGTTTEPSRSKRKPESSPVRAIAAVLCSRFKKLTGVPLVELTAEYTPHWGRPDPRKLGTGTSAVLVVAPKPTAPSVLNHASA